jgi:hypothetical protein
VSNGQPSPVCNTNPRTRCWFFFLSESRKRPGMPAASEPVTVLPVLISRATSFSFCSRVKSTS